MVNSNTPNSLLNKTVGTYASHPARHQCPTTTAAATPDCMPVGVGSGFLCTTRPERRPGRFVSGSATCAFVASYAYPPVKAARDWLEFSRNHVIEITSAEFSTRRSMLGALILSQSRQRRTFDQLDQPDSCRLRRSSSMGVGFLFSQARR